MNNVELLVKDSINSRKLIEEKVKEDVETVLEGFTLTSLDDISNQLTSFGESFLDDHLEEISDTADAGADLAKSIIGLAEKRTGEN